MSLEELLRKNMWKIWKWDDLLAMLLVLMTFASIAAVIPLVRNDPAFKRLRAREDCRTLARAIELSSKLRRRHTLDRGILNERTTTLLFTGKGARNGTNSPGTWPLISPSTRPWRCYGRVTNEIPQTFQDVKQFLKNFHTDHRREQDVLSRASSVGLDPWGRRYLINPGNMTNKEPIESGVMLLTWAISAGPNGMIETPDYVALDFGPEDLSQTALPARGDDIGCGIGAQFWTSLRPGD